MNGNSAVYTELTLLLLVISYTQRENLAKFSCILQPESGVSLAQIPPSFLAFYSQTVEYPWLTLHQVFLHFAAGLWSILGSNSTKFPCILQLDSGVSLAHIPPSFHAFYSQTLEYPQLDSPSNQSTLLAAVGPVLTYVTP